MFLSQNSICRASLPLYVQVDARPEARLLPPPNVPYGEHGGVSQP
jgi:hypothetical protein